jgi:2-polyprenyl-3-methyl-5-hydroxy-6-metoxy-1,4-benzoquinol methylase
MTEDQKTHWHALYQTTAATDVSWYQPVPERSLEWIVATGVGRHAAILDVGGGASTLVDHLLRTGFTDVTVLDIAAAAFVHARTRLGEAAARVQWIEAAVTSWRPGRRYAVWHDRALLHFLVDPAERAQYIAVLEAALAPHAHAIIATFGPAGPTRCSGLNVARYSVDDLSLLLGPTFCLVRSQMQEHTTPAGRVQQFLYTWWRTEA